jgi:para-nitrobenzyl esterase
MIVHPMHWLRTRLAAACCAALAAVTLAAAGATAANAGTATTASGSGGPIVTTDDGAVHGTTAGTVNEFLGIPYAAPPTGNLRWRPPQPPADWRGVHDATQFAPSGCRSSTTQRKGEDPMPAKLKSVPRTRV